MRRYGWQRAPHSGGTAIPDSVQCDTQRRILAYASKQYAGRFLRIEVRFRGHFCYIDAFCEPAAPTPSQLRARRETRQAYLERARSTPLHLCRLRYFRGLDRWSVAFYTYSHEKYEPSFFPSGEDLGTPEEGFEVGAIYLQP